MEKYIIDKKTYNNLLGLNIVKKNKTNNIILNILSIIPCYDIIHDCLFSVMVKFVKIKFNSKDNISDVNRLNHFIFRFVNAEIINNTIKYTINKTLPLMSYKSSFIKENKFYMCLNYMLNDLGVYDLFNTLGSYFTCQKCKKTELLKKYPYVSCSNGRYEHLDDKLNNPSIYKSVIKVCDNCNLSTMGISFLKYINKDYIMVRLIKHNTPYIYLNKRINIFKNNFHITHQYDQFDTVAFKAEYLLTDNYDIIVATRCSENVIVFKDEERIYNNLKKNYNNKDSLNHVTIKLVIYKRIT